VTTDDLALAFLYAASAFIGFVLGRRWKRQVQLTRFAGVEPDPVEE
jgi:hypothetical protein